MIRMRLLGVLLGMAGLSFVFSTTVFSAVQTPALPGQPHSQRINSNEVPEGLSRSDWAGIQAEITAAKYRAVPQPDGGFISSNPAHGWQLHFSADGTTTLKPRDSQAQGYHLRLKLSALGYTKLQDMDHPQEITADDSTVVYRWSDSLRERWVNNEAGLEQWFELKQRPPGTSNGQPLTLEMTLGTELEASQIDNALVFVNAADTTISYSKLKVWDSMGTEIPALMHLQNNTLSLVIDDRMAIYPLTVDPVFQQQAYLKASNTGADDNFGESVAISGDTVVVSAPGEASNATGVNGDQLNDLAYRSGAAYVFTRTAGVWSQQAYLKASNSQTDRSFGSSLALSGDTLVVGAPSESSNATGVNGDQLNDLAYRSGAAYVFTRTAGVWSQQAYLKASNTGVEDYFGNSVAIDGDTVVVGSLGEDSNATGINGDQTNNSLERAGAAYVFTRTAGVWSQQAYLKASNTRAWGVFGLGLAVFADTLVVGSIGESSNATGVNGDQTNNSLPSSGAAYVFTRTAGVWSQQAYLKASNSEIDDGFGRSPALFGDTLVVGAMNESSNATGVNGDQGNNSAYRSGAAYVFTRTAGVWSQQAYLKASNTGVEDYFGHSVAISGDTVAVGASFEASNATGVNGDQLNDLAYRSGAAYVFTRSAGVWSQQAYLKASNTGELDKFGNDVAISGNMLVVGAVHEHSIATGVNGDQANNSAPFAGAAYMIELVFKIGGNVSGLSGSGLVLQNNAANDRAISANGGFTFSTALADGSAYAVTVKTQPTNPSQTCSVTNGSGSLAGADVTNVSVSCVTNTYTIGGTVSGLTGTGLVLQNNAANDRAISANGSFTFDTPLNSGSAYAVTVKTQPTNPSQTCSVSNGSGTLAGANVTNVSVSCVTNTYTIGGAVSGLSGSGLVLQNNAANDRAISANGGFTFSTALADGSAYAVTVKTQPTNPSQTCSVTNGSGSLAGADVTNVSVSCVTNTYSVGGTVIGLAGNGLVLQNNLGDNLSIGADGSFAFVTALDDASAYSVTVLTQPSTPSQTCSVSNSSGNLAGSNITDVLITCMTDQFTIGGTVSGLSEISDLMQFQIGGDIDGEAASDMSGASLALSKDGKRVAIGADFNNGNGLDSGHVRVYGWNGSVWEQLGEDIDGEASSNFFGDSVAMSDDGSRVAIGAGQNDGGGNNSGHVRVFDWNGTSWIQVGVAIEGEMADDLFGLEVALSSSGGVLAASAPGNNGGGLDSGHVRVFHWSGVDWQQMGQDIDGEFANDIFGNALDISSDGTRLVVGAPQNDGNGGLSGHVRIFDWNGLTWEQVGSDIDGDASGNQTGTSVAISADGQIVAVGSPASDINGDESGQVNLYQWTGSLWIQLGAAIQGEISSERLGFSLALTDSGDRIAAGSLLGAGRVRLFEWNGINWLQLGTGIEGEAEDDEFGLSLALSANGQVMAVGAPGNDGIGLRAGHVRVFGQGRLTLQNNGGDDLAVLENGAFSFLAPLDDLLPYSVTVLDQPSTPSQTCAVSNGSGNLAGSNITDVSVNCVTDTFSVGGTVTGLFGSGLELQNNGADDLLVSEVGEFDFTTELEDLSSYFVTVLTQPGTPSQTCSVSNGAGRLASTDIDDVNVSCVTNKFTVGGSVSGLSGSGLVLQNNLDDDLTISKNGSFTFETALDDLSAYSVTVFSQPGTPSQTCTVSNGSGNFSGANVTNISVSCITNQFTVGGYVAGLDGSGLVLQNNGGDKLSVSNNGSFTFAAALSDLSHYSVAVRSQPGTPSQTCSVTNGSGTLAGADVTNVSVNCVTNTFSIGGSVSGLSGSGLVLQNNAANDRAISANGGFTFTTKLSDGSGYAVTVRTQPTNPSQTCSVTNGSGSLAGANVTNVSVTCVTENFTVGGNVSGLSGTGLMLQNNAGDDLPISASGGFIFSTALDDGNAYAVTVKTQPASPSQTCSVTDGSGSLNGADVTNVSVTCVTDTFTVGGNVSGLTGTGLVLQNNAGDDLSISLNGNYSFATALDDLTPYAVTVKTQPASPSQTCSVTDGSGTLDGANVTDVAVTCTTNTYSVGGTVSGLAGNGLMLQNNAGDDLVIGADGDFTFTSVLDDGSSYAVTVKTHPTDPIQRCSITNGIGTLAGADATDVNVSCVTLDEIIFSDGFE